LRYWASLQIVPRQLRKRRRPTRCLGRGLAHDVGLGHDVVSTTNHHKMFDIVTADEDDASFSVDRQGFDYGYPR
jgi:hypothetical protein